jgi:hypothetical protein
MIGLLTFDFRFQSRRSGYKIWRMQAVINWLFILRCAFVYPAPPFSPPPLKLI